VRFRKTALAGATTVAAVMVLTLISAAPALASPLGTGPVCDRESPYQMCLSANGTDGDNVYAKAYSTDKEENTTVTAANVCGGTDVVNGASTVCPFMAGSGKLNTEYHGDLIVQLHNTSENNVYYLGIGDSLNMFQGAKGTGYLWVLDPISKGSSTYYLVNVASSSTNQTTELGCSTGPDNSVVVSPVYFPGGFCTWVFP
jgi:hypothetical protein